jgi:hypothetical protein
MVCKTITRSLRRNSLTRTAMASWTWLNSRSGWRESGRQTHRQHPRTARLLRPPVAQYRPLMVNHSGCLQAARLLRLLPQVLLPLKRLPRHLDRSSRSRLFALDGHRPPQLRWLQVQMVSRHPYHRACAGHLRLAPPAREEEATGRDRGCRQARTDLRCWWAILSCTVCSCLQSLGSWTLVTFRRHQGHSLCTIWQG